MVFIAVFYARVSVRTWFVPTLHKPFFTCFYCRFLCKSVSEDLICPYTKEALLHMDFIAISYAKLYMRTRSVPSLKKVLLHIEIPLLFHSNIQSWQMHRAFQLWTPTYFKLCVINNHPVFFLEKTGTFVTYGKNSHKCQSDHLS